MTGAELLKAYRARHGWTQQQAADATRVPARTWAGWEAGRQLPQAPLLTRLLAEVLAR